MRQINEVIYFFSKSHISSSSRYDKESVCPAVFLLVHLVDVSVYVSDKCFENKNYDNVFAQTTHFVSAMCMMSFLDICNMNFKLMGFISIRTIHINSSKLSFSFLECKINTIPILMHQIRISTT
jgi:hypothetical protein